MTTAILRSILVSPRRQHLRMAEFYHCARSQRRPKSPSTGRRRLADAGDAQKEHEDDANLACDLPNGNYCSENILERELQCAVAALTCDQPERAAGRIGVRAVPVRMIHHVENFEAELQPVDLGDI